jgi:hypothetical protein
MKRMPRDIDITEPGEKVECDRIMKTFETLFIISRRVLKKYYLDIEEMMPRIGQGLKTMSNAQSKEEEEEEDDVDKEDVWKQRNKGSPGYPEDDILEDDDADLDDNDIDDNGFTTIPRRISRIADGLVVRRKTEHRLSVFNESGSEAGGEIQSSSVETNANEVSTDKKSPISSPASSTGSKNDVSNEKTSPPTSDSTKPVTQNVNNAIPVAAEVPNQTSSDPAQTAGLVSNKTGVSAPVPPQGFNMGMTPPKPAVGAFHHVMEFEDTKKALQRDVNHVFAELDRALDYTLVCISNVLLVLSFAEILKDTPYFTKYMNYAHELSGNIHIDFLYDEFY